MLNLKMCTLWVRWFLGLRVNELGGEGNGLTSERGSMLYGTYSAKAWMVRNEEVQQTYLLPC